MADRIVLVEHDDDGNMRGEVYHHIRCLESGWVYGAIHGSAPITGQYRAVVFGAETQGLRPCSYCKGEWE